MDEQTRERMELWERKLEGGLDGGDVADVLSDWAQDIERYEGGARSDGILNQTLLVATTAYQRRIATLEWRQHEMQEEFDAVAALAEIAQSNHEVMTKRVEEQNERPGEITPERTFVVVR